MGYDLLLLLAVDFFILVMHPSNAEGLPLLALLGHSVLAGVCIFGCRMMANVYRQVWRYGGPSAYIRLICADAVGGFLYHVISRLLPLKEIEFIRAFSLVALNLLLAMSLRLFYLYLYRRINHAKDFSGWWWRVIGFVTALPIPGRTVEAEEISPRGKINIAIVGAGRVGANLADELRINPRSPYCPVCFIDIDRAKAGREIYGVPVLSVEEVTPARLKEMAVREIVFAVTHANVEQKKALFEHYRDTGCRLKVYDLLMQTQEGERHHIRDFAIEDLLGRTPVEMKLDDMGRYYRDKVILITGGGGSIGGEISRQVSAMAPKQLILLDVYENGVYEIQQELRQRFGQSLPLTVEIASVCDRDEMEKILARHRPDVVIHAAAHKHVPLMERNCCEAVKNNVFGTQTLAELCEKYAVGRFMLVSTDKAVNPTNVMGATKRLCEMIVLSRSGAGAPTVYSVTRFGNVLGSAGSVIPLFRRQILSGGPITITDKRIIRYFMTIPEASQLVLQSGAMAENGELFVLDMGKPVRILELAENMIRLSGYEPYLDIHIREIGLRPGEKLYEELLIDSENLEKTANSLIFIERDEPLSPEAMAEKLTILRRAAEDGDDEAMREALHRVVPTFVKPETVNSNADGAREIQMVHRG